MKNLFLKDSLLGRLDPQSQEVIRAIGAIADKDRCSAFLVGGPVRDLILKRPVLDLDITVESDAMVIAKAYAKLLNVDPVCYPAFKTATVPGLLGRDVDFVTARKEIYPKPAVFPLVKPSTIKDDLFRRDFTINAMAIVISGKAKGKLLDPFGGLKDLRSKKIRVMHALSFMDDPTRILRAARFAGRLNATVERKTMAYLKHALQMGALAMLKGSRLAKEIKKIDLEPKRKDIYKRLTSWGALQDGV